MITHTHTQALYRKGKKEAKPFFGRSVVFLAVRMIMSQMVR